MAFGKLGKALRKVAHKTTHTLAHNPVSSLPGIVGRTARGYISSVGQTVRHPTVRGVSNLAVRTGAAVFTGGASEIGFSTYDLKRARDRSARAATHYRSVKRSALQAADETQRSINALLEPVRVAPGTSFTTPVNDELQGNTVAPSLFPLLEPGGTPDTSPAGAYTQLQAPAPDDRGTSPAPVTTTAGGKAAAIAAVAVAAYLFLRRR